MGRDIEKEARKVERILGMQINNSERHDVLEDKDNLIQEMNNSS